MTRTCSRTAAASILGALLMVQRAFRRTCTPTPQAHTLSNPPNADHRTGAGGLAGSHQRCWAPTAADSSTPSAHPSRTPRRLRTFPDILIFVSRVGFSKGWALVGVEESAPLVPDLDDFCEATGPCAMSAFGRVAPVYALRCRRAVLRTPSATISSAPSIDAGSSYVEQGARHVLPRVAMVAEVSLDRESGKSHAMTPPQRTRIVRRKPPSGSDSSSWSRGVYDCQLVWW